MRPLTFSLLSRPVAGLLALLGGLGSLGAQAQIQPLLPLRQGGFETPDLGTGTNAWAYAPTGSAWTFVGSSGLAGNGSAFTAQNPPAPQGDQVALLQGQGSFSQIFSVTPGRYRITVQAAQRNYLGTNTQAVRFLLDGATIDTITPTSTNYAPYATNSFLVSAGTHTLQLVGVNPQGGDNTAFLDQLSLEAFATIGQLWSNPATWGGAVPGPTTVATIPAGQIVLLDTNASVKTLQVDGELHCKDQSISLTAEKVMVHGRFECGSVVSPFANPMTLTLTGAVGPNDPATMGDKVLGAMMSGRIELHGPPRASWTQLATTAPAGATSLTLATAVDWLVGDQIVIAPTREAINQGEVVTITAVLSSTLLQFSPALAYQHYGAQSTYTNGTGSWTLDERAEVGLLTRNLKIQGDAASDATGLGGHMMTMAGTTVHVSGVEFYRMGQKALLGRYPFHWHLLGSAPGQSITNSSIHKSFNRCVTVHGTHDTLVADNVCYDFIGHGYFLEDGIEQRNVFDHNLGIWAKKPLPGQNVPDPDLLDTDYRVGQASNGPAVFWIGHPDNVYTGNAAAGSEGTGFWYGMQDTVGEPSKTYFGVGNVNPRQGHFGTFTGNRVHSSRQGFSSCRDDGGPFGMEPPNEALITGLTVSNTEQAVWPCSPLQNQQNHRFVNLVVANSPNGMQAPDPMTFQNSAFIAYSNNAPPAASPSGGTDWRAIQVYDQGFQLENVHFVNYDRPAMTVFYPGSGAHKLAKNRGQGLSFSNSPNLFLDPSDFSQPGAGPAEWGDVVHDLDGSFVGAGYAVVNDHPIMYDATCVKPLAKKVAGYACPHRYGQFRAEHFSPISPITVMRSDGTNNTSGHIVERFITEIILNDKYFYTWRYTQGMKHNRMQVSLQDAWPGDTAVYEFLDVPKTYSVETPGWSQAQDESDLFAGPGHRYYYRQGSLFLKMLASGATWHAMDVVDLCMTGPGCSPGLLTLPPLPSVQITSPLDGERVASGSTVTVNVDASIAAPNNIRAAYLYVGTDILGADRIAPYSFTLTGLPDGAYPLKVVVEASNNQSYTAVQQLFVGEPGPRVEITNLADNQTYPASQPLTVAFNVYNWTVSPNGSHLQLVIDDLDGGPLYTAAPVVLSNLSQGEHEIEIALAEASGKVTAVTDRVKIYIAANQVLADFEDGIDSRTTLTADDPNVGVTPIGFAWGTADAVASRADGEDDINWYDIVLDGAPYGFATWRLKLDPAESWVGWTKLEITTDGIPFEAIVTDAQQGDTSLGMRTGTVTVLNLPTNSTLIDQVVALKLHYDESILSSNPARQHLRKIRLLP